MTGTLSTVGWAAGLIGAVVGFLYACRWLAHNGRDEGIDDMIRARGVNRVDGQRQRWETFEPALREAAARKRLEADARRQAANRLYSTPVATESAEPHATVPFRRQRGGRS